MKIRQLIIWILVLSSSVKAQNTDFAKVLRGHKATLLSLAVDSSGKYVCSGSYDSDVILWDYNSGKLLKKYTGLSGGVWNVKISPDNKYVAAGSWDNNDNARGSSKNCLVLLNLESLNLVKSLSIRPDRFKTLGSIPEWDDSTANGISKISFNPSGTKLAVITNRGDLFIWDLKDNFKKRVYWYGDTKHKLIDISPDWKYVLCTQRKRSLADSGFYFLTLNNNKVVANFDKPAKTVIDVFFSHNMKTIASTGGNRIKRNEIYLWDIKTQRLKHILIGHSKMVRSIAFSSDDNYLASVGEDNLINLWNVSTGDLIGTFTEGNGKELTSVVFSKDDKYIITGSQDKTIKYWNVKNLLNRKYPENIH